ncbi:MAG: UV DNA damage repair endonuclease UvsE [Candidatus Bathyarchaeota archaeon]|nr:UV DNA damage repair endonuclease UvsE [Candidatus Bathyarchaeota archaeon]
MKIGYPCINNSIGCTSGHTFRLKSYSEERLKDTIKQNLDCLQKTLEYNKVHGLLFFRVCSGIVPFASHPINTFNWQNHFRDKFGTIGAYAKQSGFRISVHPDQFTLINSPSQEIFENSKKELLYHAQLLDLMQLDTQAKIQIHVGGAYGNKTQSMQTFIDRYRTLQEAIKQRLVIENDERLYNTEECLEISVKTGVPVVFDVLHDKINHQTAFRGDYFERMKQTWNQKRDGLPMVDYSSQKIGGKPGQHAPTLDAEDFSLFLAGTQGFDFDVMLEIKDKETSAVKALLLAEGDPRIVS